MKKIAHFSINKTRGGETRPTWGEMMKIVLDGNVDITAEFEGLVYYWGNFEHGDLVYIGGRKYEDFEYKFDKIVTNKHDMAGTVYLMTIDEPMEDDTDFEEQMVRY